MAATGWSGTSAPSPSARERPWGNRTQGMQAPPAPHLVPAVSPEKPIGPDIEDGICLWVLQDEAIPLSLEHVGAAQLAPLRSLRPLHRHPEGIHCGDRDAQGRAQEAMSPVPGEASPCHRSPSRGAAAGQAPQKVARNQGSSRTHLRLLSSKWSSRPSPGPASPRCPLCFAGPPRQHRWGRFPDKESRSAPDSASHISPWVPLHPLPPSPQLPGPCHPPQGA